MSIGVILLKPEDDLAYALQRQVPAKLHEHPKGDEIAI
jgi:hypothetical protein